MIKVREYEIKHTIDEVTIEQFEKVAGFTNDMSLSQIDRYMNILEYLGLPEEVWEDMEVEEFKQVIEDFNTHPENPLEFQSTIEIDGYTYRAFDKEFSLTIKDMRYIESAVKKDATNWMAQSMAVIFKREDLSKVEHYDNAHLKQKTKLFKSQIASLAVPYINHIGKELNTALEAKVDEPTEVVE